MKKFKSAYERRKARVRARVRGTKDRPRLTVFRSNKYTYAQIIDDEQGVTLVAASEKELLGDAEKRTKKEKDTEESIEKLTKTQRARLVGELLAKKALEKNIKKVAFDRGAYKYHGRIKALAEAAREQGLQF